MYDLSIVIPTCNRAALLRQGLERIRDDVRCSCEIIVVDGASTDDTEAVLSQMAASFQDRLKIIREDQRQGFVRAANKGFRAATGRNMIWLNDDARALPGTIDEAVRQIDRAPQNVAFLAMYHRYASERNVAYEAIHDGHVFRLCHVRATLYANFPIGRRETYEKLDYFDERFYFYGADPDLSLKAWHAGMRIEPASGCFVDHDEHTDDRRAEDAGRAKEDNNKLFAKWNLPDRNPLRNDFTPARPCTLRGLRESTRVTFIISTFNRRVALLNTLKQLESLQGAEDFCAETIVVDNNSSDKTADAVESEFPGVRLIRLTNNRGACAKNAGLAHETGEFVVFLDDDSYPDTTSIRRMIDHFRTNPRLGAAAFDVILPDGKHEASAFPGVFVGCGAGFRREALRAAGGLPDDFFMQAEEYDLSLRLLDAGWDIERFEDLRVWHLKTFLARQPQRTTRLDVRNNLLVIARRFPRKWIRPYAIDWLRRYRWMAGQKDRRHRFAFWLGLIEGAAKSLQFSKRREISQGAFEKFARIREIESSMKKAMKENELRSILLIDVGKNIYAYWLAAQNLKLRIVAIADANLGGHGHAYRGIPVVCDAEARTMKFDAAIVATISPVASLLRAAAWRSTETRPVIDLFEKTSARAAAA